MARWAARQVRTRARWSEVGHLAVAGADETALARSRRSRGPRARGIPEDDWHRPTLACLAPRAISLPGPVRHVAAGMLRPEPNGPPPSLTA